MFIKIKTLLLSLFLFALSPHILANETSHSIKKVLFINSYHKGYEWSDGIEKGIRSVLSTDKYISLKTIEMDTKRHNEENFKINAGLKVKNLIESYQPDIVIAADDNASKYVVQSHYKNADLPFVFCGVNWDASIYDYPYLNTTGMVEVGLVQQVIKHLNRHAKFSRIGFISDESITARKEYQYHQQLLGVNYKKSYFVKNFTEWQQKYLQLQSEVDMIFFNNNAGIADWDTQKAKDFIQKNSRIPSGSQYLFMAPYVAITLAKIPEEQGIWSAKTAISVLEGTKINSIPLIENSEGKLILNMTLIKILGMKIPIALLKIAEIIK